MKIRQQFYVVVVKLATGLPVIHAQDARATTYTLMAPTRSLLSTFAAITAPCLIPGTGKGYRTWYETLMIQKMFMPKKTQ